METYQLTEFIDSLSFEEYPPTEILGSDIYLKSLKNLSFQYRSKDGDDLIAYIALSKEPIPISVPTVEKNMVGCRILGIYAEATKIKGCNVDNASLLAALLQEAEYYISGWVELKTHNFEFDYYWFAHDDITMSDIVGDIASMATIDSIYFKLVNRHGIQPMNEKIKHNTSESYLQSLTDEQRDKEMSEWNIYEWEQYYCPNGTMTLEEFFDLLKKKCDEVIAEKYGRDYID